jgi:hypothetical protein
MLSHFLYQAALAVLAAPAVGETTMNPDLLFKISLLLGGVAVLALVFFGFWVRHHYKQAGRKADQQHQERMKVLDVGLPLPDAELARAQSEHSRINTAGAIGILVPLFMAGAATGVTALIVTRPDAHVNFQVALLCTVWGVAGLVSLVTVILSLAAIRRGSGGRVKPDKKAGAETPAGEEALSPEIRDAAKNQEKLETLP